MDVNGNIIFIEDDEDDREIFAEMYGQLDHDNKILFFSTANKALEHLKEPDSSPFLIFSDLNLPGMSGFELRDIVFSDPCLKDKTVPYIFLTTSSSPEIVKAAYGKSIQGFFKKSLDYAEQKKTLNAIINYWKDSITP